MNESFIVIMILVIILLCYSFQSFSQLLNNTNISYAIISTKELHYDDSYIIEISSTNETTELQGCPEGFFINQSSKKCYERPLTAEEYFIEKVIQQFKASNKSFMVVIIIVLITSM